MCEDFKHKFEVPSEVYFQKKLGIYKAKVVECTKCGIRYTNPILSTEIGNLQYTDSTSRYNTGRFNTPEQLYSEEHLICYEELKNHLRSPRDKILDFGCGRGGFVYLCQQNQIDAVGIDLNPNSIRLGLSLGVKNLYQKDLNYIETDSFDFITAIHVLEHLDNCYDVVSEFKRILKPNGYVFVLVPNSNSVKCKVNYRLYWKSPYQHMNGFSTRSLDILFSQFDFKKIPMKGKYTQKFLGGSLITNLSMLLTKYCGNLFNFFPTKLFCVYRQGFT